MKTWWTFRIFLIFCCSGTGKGESEAAAGEGFIENPRKGGVSRTGGVEGPGGCLRRIGEFGGGGVNIFLGPEKSTKKASESDEDDEDSPLQRFAFFYVFPL